MAENAITNSTKKPYRVLSLDGGGMRGLYTATVLNTIASRFSYGRGELDIGKGFDLITGTSTGGILACALAAGEPIQKVIEIYQVHGQVIFSCPLPQNKFAKGLWAIRNFLRPANDNIRLSSALKSIFKDQTIGSLFQSRKIALCIPAVNLATHKSQVFKTAHNSQKNADDNRLLVDVCLASSAAPIILPIASIDNPHIQNQSSHFADGGLWANNPVLVALIEALQISDQDQPIEIISIGTCPPPSGVALIPKEIKRGVLGWNFGIKALELSMDAQASGHQFMAKFLVDHLRKYNREVTLLRLEQSAPSSDQSNHLGLDNASKKACSTLIELGNSDALNIYGKALSEKSDYNILQTIFKSMPTLLPEKNQ